MIVDHVADAYEYFGSWVTALARGDHVEVSPAVVDELNARHAAMVELPTREAAIEHLLHSGDAFAALIGSLDADELSSGEGRIVRLAEISALHADGHRTELEAALGLST